MKKKIILLAFCVPIVAAKCPIPKPNYVVNLPSIKVETITDKELINALINVESANNDNAYRSCEGAAGALQIRRTMVRDVNRILRRQKSNQQYTYEDRWNRQKSIEMFNIYCNHYNLFFALVISDNVFVGSIVLFPYCFLPPNISAISFIE